MTEQNKAEIPQDVKDKIASYIYKWPEVIQSGMEKDILFGYSLAQQEIAGLKLQIDQANKHIRLLMEEIDNIKHPF